jgi:TRAP-type mannitol/chloroaromatic compound transport system permease small subunit
MGQLLAVSEALDRFLTRVGNWAAWLLVPLVVVIIVDVITRKFQLLTTLTGSMRADGKESTAHFIESYLTSTKFQELEWHLHAALFLLCLGYAYVRNSHVRIELVRERFDLRTRAWTELIGCIVFLLPYASLVLYFSYDFALRSFEINEVSSALTGLPYRWVIKSFVPIGMVLLLLAAFAVAARNAVFLFGPPDLSNRAQSESPELHLAAEELIQAVAQEAEEIIGQKINLPGDTTEQAQ